MLSPREQQSEWTSRLSIPAVVSVICLIATILIASQGFRGHPAHKGPNWFSRSQQIPKLDPEETAATSERRAQTENAGTAILKSSIDLEAADGQKKVKHVDHLTGTKDLATGPHKEKEQLQIFQHERDETFANITATREELFGMEVLIINQTLSRQNPKGVLLLFHGCSHSAIDWWYPSENCTTCLGLPEELNITKAAVRRNFAVVAFSSLDREMHRCWDTSYPPEKSKDIPVVMKAWEFLVEENGWEAIPHFALGGSSGGAFVLYLAQRVQFNGLIPIIMSVPSMFLEKQKEASSMKATNIPPTFYISMERDQIILEGGGVASNMATLTKQGIPVKAIEVGPKPLSPDFFSERIESIDNATSSAMFTALTVEGCLNSTGFLVENPRALLMMKRWQKALRDHVPSTKSMNFNKDESAIFEELNVAWAGHELVSDHIDTALDWLLKQFNRDSSKLLGAINP